MPIQIIDLNYFLILINDRVDFVDESIIIMKQWINKLSNNNNFIMEKYVYKIYSKWKWNLIEIM